MGRLPSDILTPLPEALRAKASEGHWLLPALAWCRCPWHSCSPSSWAFYLPPPRCSSAVRNGLLLLNLIQCNHPTLGDQIITQELRDTLFRDSGVAPGTEPMPTTRTIVERLLRCYSAPPASPQHTGKLGGGVNIKVSTREASRVLVLSQV